MDLRDKKIKEEVQKTLQVPDNIKRSEGNPYLLTRIKARLEKTPEVPQTSWSSNPLPLFMVAILVLNSFILFKTFPSSQNAENNVLTELFFPAAELDVWDEY